MKQFYQLLENSITIKSFIFMLCLLFPMGMIAQTTNIPDQNFEQHLIDEGIDSDGTLNGQVLTSDIAGVVTLYLSGINDVTGLEYFIALEELVLLEGGQLNTTINLDLTNNNSLKKIYIDEFAGLASINVTNLVDLEELIVNDVFEAQPLMKIKNIDLSTNINIKKLVLANIFIDGINLKNGNNQNMNNFDLTVFTEYAEHSDPDAFCAEVDDATAATANAVPYNSWSIYGEPTYYDQGECMLAIEKTNKTEVSLFPNPVQNVFQIKTTEQIEGVNVFSVTGEKVANFDSESSYDISKLSSGIYFVKIKSTRGERVQRIVKQ